MTAITTRATSTPPALSGEQLTAAIRQEHKAASAAAGAALAHALEAGRLLAEARAAISHGGWESYVRESCGIAPRTASLYLRLHRHRDRLPNRQHVADLSVRQAARLLEQPRAKAKAEPVAAGAAERAGELRLHVPEWYRPGVENNVYHPETQWFFQVWPTPAGEPWVHLIVYCPDRLGSWSHLEGPMRGIRCDALGLFLRDRTLPGMPDLRDAGWEHWYEPTPAGASEKPYNCYLFNGDEDYAVRGLGLRPSRNRRRKARQGASA
jgi:hypothetical protein